MELVVRLQEAQEAQRQFTNTLAAQMQENQRQHDQVLQGLVNVEMGEAALSLAEQLHRG